MNQKIKTAKNKAIIKEIIINFFTIIILTAIVGVITYILNRPTAEIIRNTITFLWGCFVVIFLWYQCKHEESLEYDNQYHPLRFLIVFIVCFFVSIGMIFAPTSTWVFLSIMVVLSMFSNSIIGLASGSFLLLMTSFLSNSSDISIFHLYFMIGLLGVSFFRNLDLDFQVVGPMVLSCISSFVLQTAYFVIFENQPFTFGVLFMPLLNLFINMVLLVLILKYFSGLSMYLLQDKYSDINDQEFPLMSKLKTEDKDTYFEAIHTAYLGERIARKLNLNDKAVKGCCYYYKIANKLIEQEDGTQISIAEYYEFPEDLQELILECQKGIYGSKESCVVLTSNKVIKTILISQQNFKEKNIPYEVIIDKIFEKFFGTDLLNNCDISIRELRIMKNTYIEENLYYDFLR
ncbi:MAG: hypothetical protein IKW30_06450 [Lachnospiraceae bacterium]|nr:hypothetical protein [Lachnospiraceae bacterium]